jgi:hypothetical protein
MSDQLLVCAAAIVCVLMDVDDTIVVGSLDKGSAGGD